MKTKFSKLIVSFVFGTILMIGATVPVYAADVTSAVISGITQAIINSTGASNMSNESNQSVSGTISCNGYEICHPYLNDSIDVKKSFTVTTSSDMPGGAVFVYLYRNGREYSRGWAMGVNDSASWTVNNPPAGEYTLKVATQGNATPVKFTASWVD